MDIIKPCPFCGSKPKFTTFCDTTSLYIDGRHAIYAGAKLRCPKCRWLELEHYINALSEKGLSAEEKETFKDEVVDMCVNEVLDKWNARAGEEEDETYNR